MAEVERSTTLLKHRHRREEAEPLERIGGVLKRPGDAAEATRQRFE